MVRKNKRKLHGQQRDSDRVDEQERKKNKDYKRKKKELREDF